MAQINSSELEQLKANLLKTAEVVTPESENYGTSLARWSSAAIRNAGIIVFPTSASDVSKAVLFSKTHNLELAVKGGGHSTSGSSSTDGGLCIDLSKMRAVSVDTKSKTISAQGGALWSDVDTEAEKFGLAVVGGTVNHTGIGGLTLGGSESIGAISRAVDAKSITAAPKTVLELLGLIQILLNYSANLLAGGYGYLTGKAGLVIDNLLEVEMVLADGSIVTASDTENPELFWAVKGAGASFGVVTKFVYRAHEQKGLVWGGILVFPKTQLEGVVAFANTVFNPEHEGIATILLVFGAPPPALQPVIMAGVFFNGEEKAAKEFYKPLLNLGPLADMTSAMPYSEANAMLNDAMFPGVRRNMKGSAFLDPLDYKFAETIYEEFEAFITRVPDAGMTVVLWEFVPYHKLLSVPQNATAFANRGVYGNLLFAPGWIDPAIDGECREWPRVMAQKAKMEFVRGATVESEKIGIGEYANYDSLDENPQVLFGKNSERLMGLKKLYDPDNVFRKGLIHT